MKTHEKTEARHGRGESGHDPLGELLIDELSDILSAEQQLIKALPRMAEAAQSDELRTAIQAHLEETQEQVRRLEKAAKELGEPLKKKTCKAMEGLLKEAGELMDEHKDEPTMDAVLIAGAQKIEHYEIASYGTACAWARHLGEDEVASLLHDSLEEEKAADEKLTDIAESSANEEAEEEDKD